MTSAPVRMLICATVAGASLLAVAAAAAADRALVVGVGTYRSLPEKMFLKGPKNDVAAIRTLLETKLGYSADAIRILADGEATRAAILANIEEWLVQGTGPGDRAYLYFSGHGLQVKDTGGEEEDGLDEALATFDVASAGGEWINAILDDEIDALIGKLKDRAVTLVVDACHSGTIAHSTSADVAEPLEGARFLPRPDARVVETVKTRGLRIDLAVVDKPDEVAKAGVEAWSAASSYQIAWDDHRTPPEERQGVFTAAYVAGHAEPSGDVNANGIVSVSELFEFVKKQSADYCADRKECQGLDPQLEVNNAKLGASVMTVEEKKPEEGKAEANEAKVETAKVDGTPQVVLVAVDPVEAIGDILGREETGNVHLSLHPGVQMKNGDVFTITVESTTGGHLMLFDVNQKGMATQIFPNEAAQKITPLTAGSPLTIPDAYYGFDFEADGAGESVLVAIVVEDPLDLSKIAPASQGLAEELDARPAIADIVGALRKTWTGDTENRGIRWSLGTLKYTIY